ncbi:MAG TPA: hypothetical protein VJ867_12935 [Gemmatimonadaceae bacterium]|nr:hypothetical protein [Gemmatimonadaceae bacterium]
MTPSPSAGNLPRPHTRAVLAGALLFCVAACGRRSNGPPDAEFILAAGDSSYWVQSNGSKIALRGSPMVLARLDGRFLELYVEDDDQSFENAQFVGQRLFERDILRGDSTEIFHDTLTGIMADRYERTHPDERRLNPDEDPNEEPSTSATTDLSVLGVHGPYLSVEYHVDTSSTRNDTWHTTRHMVIDLRTGAQMTLAEVVGTEEAASVISRGRKLFNETLDSIRRDTRPVARRAARAIPHFRFDPTSFSLAAPNGTLMVVFSAPGQGNGGEGFVLPMRPIPVTEPAWWAAARGAVPTSTQEREERWQHGQYTVRAQYDTGSRPVRLSLVDSAGREFPIGAVTGPVHRIYWLDNPPIERNVRAALSRAFDEAALYDEDARTAALPGAVLAAR